MIFLDIAVYGACLSVIVWSLICIRNQIRRGRWK